MYKVLEEKEIWRLFTSLFLHGNIMHLLVITTKINIFSQLRLCFAMEKYFSTFKFSLIYLLSGLGGNLLAGFFYPNSILVGSSTALFGIFGSFACYFTYNWHILGPGRNLNLVIYLFFVIISLELPITLESVDIAGHVGGFALGVLLGFFLLPREERSETWDIILLINGIGSLAYFAVLIWMLSTLRFN